MMAKMTSEERILWLEQEVVKLKNIIIPVPKTSCVHEWIPHFSKGTTPDYHICYRCNEIQHTPFKPLPKVKCTHEWSVYGRTAGEKGFCYQCGESVPADPSANETTSQEKYPEASDTTSVKTGLADPQPERTHYLSLAYDNGREKERKEMRKKFNSAVAEIYSQKVWPKEMIEQFTFLSRKLFNG